MKHATRYELHNLTSESESDEEYAIVIDHPQVGTANRRADDPTEN